jgi:hypothetical protein
VSASTTKILAGFASLPREAQNRNGAPCKSEGSTAPPVSELPGNRPSKDNHMVLQNDKDAAYSSNRNRICFTNKLSARNFSQNISAPFSSAENSRSSPHAVSTITGTS